MSDKFNKFKGYLSEKKFHSYWRAFDPKDKKEDLAKYSAYPIDIRPRLNDGHYFIFDADGLPMVPGDNGQHIYHLTTLCGFGLAKHQMFLSSGNDEDLKAFKQCVTKVISLISWASDKGYIVQKGDKKYGSFASGMIIGEILSLLTRLYELEKDISLLKMGDGILHYFESSISDNGVIGYFSKTNSSWYEEYAFEPVKHVLNGMNYALIGLHDLAKIGGSEKAKLHFENGIEWLKKALPEYDLGWWSNYFVAEGKLPNYIASAMYHNLHIEQLRYLCKITQSELIGEYCQKFESYPKSMTRRLYAGWCLFRDKLTRK